jgi:hypothetical protein
MTSEDYGLLAFICLCLTALAYGTSMAVDLVTR